MEYVYYRGQKCKQCRAVMPIFGLGHHKPEKEGEDPFTKCVINFYNYGNSREKDYLLQRLINLFKERFEGDIKFDCICVIPTHEKDKINPHMAAFAEEFSDAVGIPYEQLVRRNRTLKAQHGLTGKDERFDNVKGSLDVVGDARGKNILVLDNLSITGANAQEVFDNFRNAGAKGIYFICFGLGSKGKDIDFDINPNFKGKASFIAANWHWPKVSKEKRQEYAKEKNGCDL